MAEEKTAKIEDENKKIVKKDENYDIEHDKTITLMAGVLIILAATSAIAVTCLYCLNNI